ncbi:MAG: hypothetical protein JOZ29_21300 [Deltaproteobacteria bacterium]|nr:hypothetical protein [Deltaproteobacteria bacterium]MBV8454782.1 hypothetical protein [Deltaproteobacteria bacterium]
MVDAESSAAAASGATEQTPKLDEVMLAMDVVDTLRHQEDLVEKELGQESRDEALKARLRQLYEGQGLEVSDHILDEGIGALRESRFVYTPPPPSFARTMAQLWVRRASIAKVGVVVLALVAAGVGWQVWSSRSERVAKERARIELSSVLPDELSAAVEVTRKEAKAASAQEAVNTIAAEGRAGLAAGDALEVRAAISHLAGLRAKLLQQYILRIVSRPGERTGFFRIPDVNQNSRNYYLIVEAIAPDGNVLRMPILNEENGKTETVTKWGVRVPYSTFDAVRRDKQDDGIVQNNLLGEKKRGALKPDYLMPVLGGTITKW